MSTPHENVAQSELSDHAAISKVREFLGIFDTEVAPDGELLVQYLAEDATYWPLVPSLAPLTGIGTIFEALKKQFSTYRNCRCEIHRAAANAGVVFIERSDRVTLNKDGREVCVRVTAVFELDQNGKIFAWREYWDSGEVLHQVGVSREAWLRSQRQ